MNTFHVISRQILATITLCIYSLLPLEVSAENTPLPASGGTPSSANAAIAELRIPSGTLHGDDIFKNVRITAVLPDGLKISHDGGVSKIPFERLPADLRAKFKFDAASAAAFRAKLEAQQKESDPSGAKAFAPKATGTATSGSANSAFTMAAQQFNAVAISPDTWAAELAGVVPTFDQGKVYAISGVWVKRADNDALLAGFDPSGLAQLAVVAAEKGGFSQVNIPPGSEIPLSISAVGVYDRLIILGKGKIPLFRCLYLEVDGKGVYKAVASKPDRSESVSGNSTTASRQVSPARWALALNSTKEECQKSMGLAAEDATEKYLAACRNAGKKPEFDGKQDYLVSPYLIQVMFKGGRSTQVFVTTVHETLGFQEAMQLFRQCVKESPVTEPKWIDKASGSFGWETVDKKVFAFTERQNGKPTLCILASDANPAARFGGK